jgi:uncharacterized protein (TIGR02186 family)
MKKWFILLILGLICMAVWLSGAAAADIQMTVTPDQVLKGATYNGQQIQVTGTLPAEASVIIRVTGQVEHRKLKKKGRALGILWMNQGAVEIADVPSVFLFYPPEGWKGLKTAAGLGLDAVRDAARIESEGEEDATLFDEFVKLKQKSGLYGTFPGLVEYGAQDGSEKTFQCTLSMPSALPTGTYQLEAVAVKDDAVVARTTLEMQAMETGMPAFISSLAFDHGTLYGVLAVLIAVIAGLLTGVLFKGGKGAH